MGQIGMHTDISIVIPAFNAQDTVPSLVQDCLSQTFENVEVICVDDGSDDGTRTVIEGLAQRHPKVYALSIEHGGPTAARAAGAQEAHGTWVIFADADDRMERTWIESLVEGGRRVDPLGEADIIAGANCWRRSLMDVPPCPWDTPDDPWHGCRGLFRHGPQMDEVWSLMLDRRIDVTKSVSHSMCDKLFRVELARDTFEGIDRSVRIGEDSCFALSATARARAVALTYARGYQWSLTPGSLSQSTASCALQDYRSIYPHVKRELVVNGYGEHAAELWRSWLYHVIEVKLRYGMGITHGSAQLAERFMASYEEECGEVTLRP